MQNKISLKDDLQFALPSLSTLAFMNITSSHLIGCELMLFITNHTPYLWGLSNSFSQQLHWFLQLWSCFTKWYEKNEAWSLDHFPKKNIYFVMSLINKNSCCVILLVILIFQLLSLFSCFFMLYSDTKSTRHNTKILLKSYLWPFFLDFSEIFSDFEPTDTSGMFYICRRSTVFSRLKLNWKFLIILRFYSVNFIFIYSQM